MRCGARFVDLERNLPPEDDPEAPRNVAKRRIPSSTISDTVPMLSGWASAMVIVTCPQCGRRDTFVKADLLMNIGDTRLTDLPRRLVTDCPRAGATSVYQLCQARITLE